MMPLLDVDVTTEVVDDEDQHVVTAGAIITVTLTLVRKTMESVLSDTDALAGQHQLEDGGAGGDDDHAAAEDPENDSDDLVELQAPTDNDEDAAKAKAEADEASKKKTPVWKKPEKKKKGGKKGGGGGGGKKQKAKAKPKAASEGGDQASAQVRQISRPTSLSFPPHFGDGLTHLPFSRRHLSLSLPRAGGQQG